MSHSSVGEATAQQHRTFDGWARRVAVQHSARMSHRRTEPSAEADAMSDVLASHARLWTASLWPTKLPRSRAIDVPAPSAAVLVVTPSGGKSYSVMSPSAPPQARLCSPIQSSDHTHAPSPVGAASPPAVGACGELPLAASQEPPTRSYPSAYPSRRDDACAPSTAAAPISLAASAPVRFPGAAPSLSSIRCVRIMPSEPTLRKLTAAGSATLGREPSTQ